MNNTHCYCPSQEPKKLAKLGDRLAKLLVKEFSKPKCKGYTPLLCYSGMSGTAIATSMSLSLAKNYEKFEFYMAYARKKNERSHGDTVEYSSAASNKNYMLVFVDDFISSGETFYYTIEKVVKKIYRDMAINVFYDNDCEDAKILTILKGDRESDTQGWAGYQDIFHTWEMIKNKVHKVDDRN